MENVKLILRVSKEIRAWREAFRRSPESAHLSLINRRFRLSKRYLRKVRSNKITWKTYKQLNNLLFKPFRK